MSAAQSLPSFFVIGAAKCGTTALHDLLSRHPEIFATEEKETHFFDYKGRYAKGAAHWLQTHYKDSAGFAARGESTPSYLHSGGKVIPRIRELYAGTAPPRFICLLRDPVERCQSHYLDMVRSTLETETLGRALELEPQRIAAGGKMRWRRYFGDGLYAQQLQPWIDAFGRHSLLILLNEDLRTRPRETLAGVFEFLGVSIDVPIDVKHRANVAADYCSRTAAKLVNRPTGLKTFIKRLLPSKLTRGMRNWLETRYRRPIAHNEKPPLPADLVNSLRARYQQDVSELERLLGRDLSHWKALGGNSVVGAAHKPYTPAP